MSNRRNFLDLCLTGKAHPEEIDDFVDAWHADPDGGDLHDFLGMTEDEYSLWLQTPDALACILKARRDREPLTQAVSNAYDAMRLARSGNDAVTVVRFRRWLREKGVLA